MRRSRRRRMGGGPLLVLLLAVLPGLSCKKGAKSASDPEAASGPEAARVPEAKLIRTKSGIEMVLIPAGWFRMGSRNGQADESPAHRVWIDAFLMDRYEVTQERYGKLVLGNPSHFKRPDRPVEQISWSDAAWYCNKRSRAEGFEPCYDEDTARCDFEANGYRLPTEAEWEYACRAGADRKYHFGRSARLLREYAWYADNSAKRTHPVGRKKPNRWLLFDMHGNVAEWCNDVYEKGYYGRSPSKNPRGPADGEQYVLRGGAWNCRAGACRSAYRVGEAPGFQDACFARDAIGFRCVRRPPPDATSRQARSRILSE